MNEYNKNHIAAFTIVAYFAILAMWVLAWILKTSFFDRAEWFVSPLGSFLYWIVMKLLIWILPSFFILKKWGLKFYDIFRTRNNKWLLWGLMIGLALTALNILFNRMTKQNLFSFSFTFSFLNAAIVAPILEEILFRAVILRGLEQNFTFRISNIMTSILFLLIHIPGWFFMGSLSSNLLGYTGISIFVLGIIFGFASKKGESVKASIIVHMLNNIS